MLKYLYYQYKKYINYRFYIKKTAILFLLLLNNTSINNIIKHYQLHINNIIVDTNHIYIYCSLFILFKADTFLIKVYSQFVIVIKAIIIVNISLDYCNHANNSFYCYKFCYNLIVEKKISNFRSANYINILLCQKYSNIFNDQTFVKKVFIAYTHFVISIIKLKPSKNGSTILYY